MSFHLRWRKHADATPSTTPDEAPLNPHLLDDIVSWVKGSK